MIRSTEMQPDVLVIGGGLIGLLTAAELAERGARVSVLEKDDVGFEQSGRSVAAINLPGGKPNSASSLLRVSAEEWSRFEERWGYGIDPNAEGWLIVVADEADREWLEVERATWQATAGFRDTELLDSTLLASDSRSSRVLSRRSTYATEVTSTR